MHGALQDSGTGVQDSGHTSRGWGLRGSREGKAGDKPLTREGGTPARPLGPPHARCQLHTHLCPDACTSPPAKGQRCWDTRRKTPTRAHRHVNVQWDVALLLPSAGTQGAASAHCTDPQTHSCPPHSPTDPLLPTAQPHSPAAQLRATFSVPEHGLAVLRLR